MQIDSRVRELTKEQKYPLIFATISGAHLYGFDSPDSDYDLRGVHVLPVTKVVGLETGQETIEVSEIRQGLEIDLVTHDVKKFFTLLLKRNGYVLEQLTSPLVVEASEAHRELLSLVPKLVTKNHSHHYLGFAQTQWDLFHKEKPKRIKPLLYVFRVLLTGIRLMRSGNVQANLPMLNEEFRLPYLSELMERKRTGAEKGELGEADENFYVREYERLLKLLEEEEGKSHLPEAPSARKELHDLLVRLRLEPIQG